MSYYFTADTHFGSNRTLKLSRRPFKNIVEMDKAFINNWNSIVDKDDIVYHLGDFGKSETIKYLNGKVVLLYGNYERDDDQDILKNADKFWYIVKEDSIKLILDDLKLNLVHEPSKMEENFFNLFGHVHQLSMVKKIENKMGLNVGIDCYWYRPIDIETILFYKTAIEKFYDEEVFM